MRPEQAAGTRSHQMTRYMISFDARAMNHIPDADMPAVAKAAHEMVDEAMNAGVWVLGGGLDPSIQPMTRRLSPSCSTGASASSELPAYARITAYMVATSFRLVDQQSIGVSHDPTVSREHPDLPSVFRK